MRILLTLLGKDFANLRRNRAAFVLSFIVPVLIILIVGWAFGLRPFGFGSKESGPGGIALAVVNQSDDPAAAKLVAALQAEKSFRIVTEFTNSDKTERPLTIPEPRNTSLSKNTISAITSDRPIFATASSGSLLQPISFSPGVFVTCWLNKPNAAGSLFTI